MFFGILAPMVASGIARGVVGGALASARREDQDEQEMFFGLMAPLIASSVIGGLSGREESLNFLNGLSSALPSESLSEEEDMFLGALVGGLARGAIGGLARGGLRAGLRGGLRAGIRGGLRGGIRGGIRGGLRGIGGGRPRVRCVMRTRSGQCLRYQRYEQEEEN